MIKEKYNGFQNEKPGGTDGCTPGNGYSQFSRFRIYLNNSRNASRSACGNTPSPAVSTRPFNLPIGGNWGCRMITPNFPPIEPAANWLAQLPPSIKSIEECTDIFGLSAIQLPELCNVANQIRNESINWEAN
jgi:hypothetical protein